MVTKESKGKPEKGQEIIVEIIDMTDQGQGIGKVEGFPLFVDDTVVGDVTRVRVTKVKKNYGFGKTVEIEEESPYRIEPECPYNQDCGGCTYGSISYEKQGEIKEKQVRDRIQRLGGVKNPLLRPMLTMEVPYHYRNKGTFPISTGGNIMRKGGVIENLGPAAVGFYRGKSHQVIDCKECLLQTPSAMAASATLRQFMMEDNITAWDEKWEQGLMKHMVVKTAFTTGEVMVVLCIHGKGIPNGEKLLTMMDDAIYEAGYSLESVFLDNGKEMIPFAGKQVIKEEMGGLHFEISPSSFYQVNPVMTEKLYDIVKDYAKLTGKENILDLYCGVGTIGLWCAKDSRYVLGIELVKEAVIDGNRNAVINGIVNARYICGKTEEEIPKLLEGKGDKDLVQVAQNAHVVIVDPPRAGCHPQLICDIGSISPERIVYVSCDPGTLARDIKAFEEEGYIFVEATPVDMFPWTKHVETVCLLSQVKADNHIEVDLKMDEMDLTQAESRATYAEIKQYVLDKTGLKVSQLYIAQVKRKYGLIERINYNSGERKSKVPQVPPEKEQAIEGALKYFKMI